jgi:uncharacterized Zn-binding protein involved in type VI secretion
MAGEIIRVGDRTSHGGTVLEGSPSDICMGKPIAFVGHKTLCPKCRGAFPIIEGVLTTTFYGKGVAVAGMKTACGAVLIASQFTDVVEWSTGTSGSGRKASGRTGSTAEKPAPASPKAGATGAGTAPTAADNIQIEQYYSLINGHGEPVPDYRYDLFVEGELHTKAGTYASGRTVAAVGDSNTQLVTWLSQDSASKS